MTKNYEPPLTPPIAKHAPQSAHHAGVLPLLDSVPDSALLAGRDALTLPHTFSKSRMKKNLRILLIEDNEDDYIVTRKMLENSFGNDFDLDWKKTWQNDLESILACPYDVYLVDYHLGECTGVDFVREASIARCNSPIILLTGQNSPEIDLAAMTEGAVDYLIKTQVSAPLLERAIRYAIERKRVESTLATLAQYDSLTGLANRALFFTMLDKYLAHAQRHKSLLAVLLLDLDHFKDVNDTWGHDVGDQLLQEVGKRLSTLVRGSDIVARLGGDEFSIIATDLRAPEDAVQFAQKILDALAPIAHLDDRDIAISSSIGIALYPSDSMDANHLFKCADIALYQTKDDCRGCVRLYDAELATKARARRTLENDISKAIREEQFFLRFQPKTNCAHNTLQGVEALIRWHHPTRGIIPPMEFIPLAEDTGQIIEIGEWVLHKACAQNLAWQVLGLPSIPIAVNLSSVQFKRTDIVESIATILKNAGVEPNKLELEITERTVMSCAEDMIIVLRRLHDLGVKLSIDDFGTGYSSLSYLRKFPLDKLKIDGSYINNIIDNPNDSAITKAIINLAKNLDMSVVAEGVETESQLLHLRGLGCEEVQGNLIALPLTSDEFIDWYAAAPHSQHDKAFSA